MQLALLWQDKTGAPLDDMVSRAAIRFRDKFGLGWPDFALVHPSALAGHEFTHVCLGDGDCEPMVIVMPDAYTQPSQVLIGIEGDDDL